MIRFTAFQAAALQHRISIHSRSAHIPAIREALLHAAYDTGIHLDHWQCQALENGLHPDSYRLEANFSAPSSKSTLLLQRVLRHTDELRLDSLGLESYPRQRRQALSASSLAAGSKSRTMPAAAKKPAMYMGSLLPKSYTDSLRG